MNKQGTLVSALDTQAVIVNLDVLEANIARMSRLAKEAGVRLRPHTKIHECPEIAKRRTASSARGIAVRALERSFAVAVRNGRK